MDMIESLVDLRMMGIPASDILNRGMSVGEYMDAFIEAAVKQALDRGAQLFESFRPGPNLKNILGRIQREQEARGSMPTEAELRRVEQAAMKVFDKAAKDVSQRGFWGNAVYAVKNLLGLAPERAEDEAEQTAKEVGDTFDDYEMEAEDTAMTLKGALTFFDSRKGSILGQLKRRIGAYISDAGSSTLFVVAVVLTAAAAVVSGASGVFWLWVAVLVFRIVRWIFVGGGIQKMIGY